MSRPSSSQFDHSTFGFICRQTTFRTQSFDLFSCNWFPIFTQKSQQIANKYSIIGPDRKRQTLSYQLVWLLTKCLKGVKKCFGSTRSQVRILSPRSVRDRFPSLSFLMLVFCCPQKCPQKLDGIREVKGFSNIYIQSRWCM